MAATTTLAFEDKISRQLTPLLRMLGKTLDAFDDVEDAASDVEDTIENMDDGAIREMESALDDAYQQATRLSRELAGVDQEANAVDGKGTSRLERALREAAKAGDEAAASLEYVDAVAGHLEEIGGLATAGGAIVTAGLSTAAIAAHDMDQALGILQANVGATDAEMSSLSESAKGVFASGLVETPMEAAEAYGRLRQLLEGTDEQIGEVAEGALALEKASFGNLDQASIAKALDVMQGQWATDPIKGLDMITAAYQRVGDKADDLLDTIWEYSPQFAEAGISAEKMMGMFVAGAEKAFNFDKLGDAFKESFGIRLNKALDEKALGALEGIFGEDKLFKMLDQIKAGGKEAENAIMTITAGIASIKDQKLQDDVLANVFGTQYEDVGRDALMSMLNAGPLEDFAGKTTEIVGQVSNEWQAMANEMKLAIDPIGDSVLEVAKPIVGLLAKIAKGIGTFTEENPFITKVAVSFLMVMAALALLVGPLIFLAGIWMPVSAGFAAMSGAMAGFGIASISALWPILLVIAAIIALIAIGWWLYENWDMVSAYLVAGWEWVKNAGIAVWDGITAYFKMQFEFWKGLFTAFIQFLTGDWSGAWETIKETFFNAFTTIDGWFDGWISGLFDSGKKIILTIVDGILSVKDEVANAIASALEWADQYLPHSDAELGPFSRLTDSGMAIPETMAMGVEASSDSLVSALDGTFSQVPSYTPSITSGTQAQYTSPNEQPTSLYIDFRPTIQLTVQSTKENTEDELESLCERIANILAEKLEHVLSGTGSIVLE
ncbi:phage tail tape measure protein [Brevibacillus sp. MER 51]|uniref:phage tail tape measure protein n=1 Tax=Brevibacillus sp. MER 51 TaxID=2939560 RepID=UPI0020401619|nr:phage tail tape measure protein [Brevibacillus sp. MER 51]MCM3143857.1 phage tail tape measure protein [Brevibacillus sp. MER 51]